MFNESQVKHLFDCGTQPLASIEDAVSQSKRVKGGKTEIHVVLISVRQNAVRTSLDFLGLLLVFVEIMPDKVILDHEKSYLVSFENFHFFQFLAKIGHK